VADDNPNDEMEARFEGKPRVRQRKSRLYTHSPLPIARPVLTKGKWARMKIFDYNTGYTLKVKHPCMYESVDYCWAPGEKNRLTVTPREIFAFERYKFDYEDDDEEAARHGYADVFDYDPKIVEGPGWPDQEEEGNVGSGMASGAW